MILFNIMGVLCKKFIFRVILVVYMNEINYFYLKKIVCKFVFVDNFLLFISFDVFF